jgi:hypothetical protein
MAKNVTRNGDFVVRASGQSEIEGAFSFFVVRGEEDSSFQNDKEGENKKAINNN